MQDTGHEPGCRYREAHIFSLAVTSTRRILVVEDDGSARSALVDLLTEEGFDVSQAGTGAEALAALDPGPALAVVDYQLPDIDGATLIRTIRARVPGCACIMVTGSADLLIDSEGDAHFSDRSNEAEQAGAVGYLPKPVDFDALLRMLQQYQR